VPPYLARDSRIHISLPAPARAPHATGLRGHSLSVLSDNLLTVDRLTLTDAARTWFDLASQVDLTDLVAAGDHIIHWRTPLLGYEELIQAVAGFSGLRGKRRLKAAGVLLNDRAESPPESTLRVIIVLGGLPEPQANTSYVVGGREVRLDLSFPQFKVALEYQGDYHRTMQGQWRRDMTRRARLEAGGWIVIEVNADDLRNSAELLARLSQVLVSRGWRA
jgi:very-short-patch-repair endonuclease